MCDAIVVSITSIVHRARLCRTPQIAGEVYCTLPFYPRYTSGTNPFAMCHFRRFESCKLFITKHLDTKVQIRKDLPVLLDHLLKGEALPNYYYVYYNEPGG